MKTNRKLSNQFEITSEKNPTKQYLYISSIPGNAKPNAYILKKQRKIRFLTQEI